jgi:plasmid stability protein
MASITIKNLPDHVHRRLRLRAESKHRSLNREIIHILTEATDEPERPDDLPERAALLRSRFGGELTREEIDAARTEGRP